MSRFPERKYIHLSSAFMFFLGPDPIGSPTQSEWNCLSNSLTQKSISSLNNLQDTLRMSFFFFLTSFLGAPSPVKITLQVNHGKYEENEEPDRTPRSLKQLSLIIAFFLQLNTQSEPFRLCETIQIMWHTLGVQ